jgi:arylsulfatase A-like enzyme
MVRSSQCHLPVARRRSVALCLPSPLLSCRSSRPCTDLGYANVGWHEPFVQTPHLDRLAREGIRFEGYYVQPICSPTRSSLMTGRYTYRLGTQAEIVESYVPFGVPLRERFMPEYFQAAGYATAMFGKWQ